jgi:hypothetical protein
MRGHLVEIDVLDAALGKQLEGAFGQFSPHLGSKYRHGTLPPTTTVDRERIQYTIGYGLDKGGTRGMSAGAHIRYNMRKKTSAFVLYRRVREMHRERSSRRLPGAHERIRGRFRSNFN